MNINTDIARALYELQVKNPAYLVIIAGGYLRDIARGVEPKDVDVFLAPLTESHQPAINVPTDYALLYNVHHTKTSFGRDMAARGLDRVIGLQNINLSTQEVQLIIYSKPMSVQEIVHDMDINICQIGFDGITTYKSGAYLSGHSTKTIVCMIDYDPARMVSRVKRMHKKFPDYEYPTIPLTENAEFAFPAIEGQSGFACKDSEFSRAAGSFVGE